MPLVIIAICAVLAVMALNPSKSKTSEQVCVESATSTADRIGCIRAAADCGKPK